MTLRSLPTGGNPIGLRNIFKSLRIHNQSCQVFPNLFPGKIIFEVSSGSAALRLALEAMKRVSSRKEVILPGYTCPSLLTAVIYAQLKPILCDLAAHTFHLDLKALGRKVSRQTLAIMPVHLYGLSEEIREIKTIAEKQDVFVLEDSAQAYGTLIENGDGLKTGDVGDLAVFSFGRGKPFSLLSGGVVVVNNPSLHDSLADAYARLPQSSSKLGFALDTAKLFAYSLLFHPRLFWIPQALPFLHIGETIFTLESDYGPMPALTKKLGHTMLAEFNSIIAYRRSLSFQYADYLKDLKNHFAFLPLSLARINLLRFPLIFRDRHKRDRCLAALKKSGLGASESYPCPLNKMAGTRPFLNPNENLPNARHIAARVLTLPLHQHVRSDDIRKIGDILGCHLSS
jgi:dTDP-4-amino-4,6-dideoxygalactose transaminase